MGLGGPSRNGGAASAARRGIVQSAGGAFLVRRGARKMHARGREEWTIVEAMPEEAGELGQVRAIVVSGLAREARDRCW